MQRVLGNVPIQHGKILPEPIQFPDMAGNRRPLIVGNGLSGQPVPTPTIEQVSMGALGNQMRMQNGMDLVLDPGPVIRVRCRTTW